MGSRRGAGLGLHIRSDDWKPHAHAADRALPERVIPRAGLPRRGKRGDCKDARVGTCQLCGRATEGHNRHVRFRLPDPVLRSPGQDRVEGTWKTADDPNSAVMMLVPNVGAFVRALLPVRLSGGSVVTFGVWVGVHPDDLRRAFDCWCAPEYAQLQISGLLANALPAWDVFGVPVELAISDPEATPYCVASPDKELSAVLSNDWDHEAVLAGLPD